MNGARPRFIIIDDFATIERKVWDTLMKKKSIAKKIGKLKAPKLKPYCAVQFSVNKGPRAWFATAKEASAEAAALIEGKKTYGDYTCPDKLAVVKIVGVIERSHTARKAKGGDTHPVKIVTFNHQHSVIERMMLRR